MLCWLRLFRIALAPTVAWDVTAGLLLAGLPLDARWPAAMGVALLVYHAGMVLNDFADRNEDEQHRPGRPLPSGRVPAGAALLAGLGMLATANALAWLLFPPAGAQLVLGLSAVVLLYDFGGAALRRAAGPPLLMLARMASLNLGLFAREAPLDHLSEATLQVTFAYGMWILCTSRLATGEEHGSHGMRSLQYVAGTALAPVILCMPPAPAWPFYPAWVLVAAGLVRPALRDRNIFWAPERVQAAVRLGLSSAPLVLGLGLLAAGRILEAAAAPLVTLSVSFLARRLPPE